MNSFDAVVYLGLVDRRRHRLQCRVAAQRDHDPRLSDRDADRGLGRCRCSSPAIDGKLASPLAQNSLLFFGIFLVVGMVLGKLVRMALDEAIGPRAGIGDRLGGAALGAVRVGLVAITLVLIFDQLVPADRQPAFLTGSQLRPLLSVGRAKGLPVAAARRRRPPSTGSRKSGGSNRRVSRHPDMHFGSAVPLIRAAEVG